MSRPSRGKKSRQLQLEIERLVRQELIRLYGAACRLDGVSRITLNLDLSDSVEDNGDTASVCMTPSLLEQIRHQLRELNVHRGAYRRGAVYCYLDESAECTHSRPGHPSHVMAEYLPNGIPDWRDFRDVLIDEHPAAAAQLFKSRDRTVAVTMRGRDIKHRLLSSFGKSSRTYNILGQIICGFFSIQPSDISDQTIDDLALTIQAVEYRDSEGTMRLGLNTISGHDDINILDHLTSKAYAAFRDKLIETERTLASIARDIRTAPADRKNEVLKQRMSSIPGLMRDIQATVLKMNQRRHRRTGHAESRSSDNRPVFTAMDDLQSVRVEDILEDPRNRTIIVPGRRRRWHVFSRNGRLVTTLFLDSEKVQSRLSRKRWRPVEAAILDAFLQKIRELYPKKT